MIENLKNKLKAIAMVEAIVSPEWEYRYYSYNSKWSNGQEMASMRDFTGTKWFLWLKGDICGWNYIDPKLPKMKNIEKVKKMFNPKFNEFTSENAFTIDDSACLWFFDGKWTKLGGKAKSIDDDFAITKWEAKDYKKWAEPHYEVDLDQNAIAEIFNMKINDEIVKKLNPDLSLKDLKKDIEEIDFPTTSGSSEKKVGFLKRIFSK